jgi:hypothetical protein
MGAGQLFRTDRRSRLRELSRITLGWGRCPVKANRTAMQNVRFADVEQTIHLQYLSHVAPSFVTSGLSQIL